MTLYLPPDNPMMGETTKMVYVLAYSRGYEDALLHGPRCDACNVPDGFPHVPSCRLVADQAACLNADAHTGMETCGACSYTVRDLVPAEVAEWRKRERAALLLAAHFGRTASEWQSMTGQQRADALFTWRQMAAWSEIRGEWT